MSTNDVQVVVSGLSWMGSGLRSIESALHNHFTSAQDEILIASYAISNMASGFFKDLKAAIERGIRVRMIINRFEAQPTIVKQKLLTLSKQYPHLLFIYSFSPKSDLEDLHAKLIITDRQRALIGSANLSLRGLFQNHEMGVSIEGIEAARAAKLSIGFSLHLILQMSSNREDLRRGIYEGRRS